MKKIFTIALLLTPFIVQAGVAYPTSHSRANCAGFNESVSWWLGHPDYRQVHSFHYVTTQGPMAHVLDTGMSHTFRAAAYHAAEAYSSRGDKWYVRGVHYYKQGNQAVVGAMTEAVDCAIYDGWWG
jgi:hypothetical protein